MAQRADYNQMPAVLDTTQLKYQVYGLLIS